MGRNPTYTTREAYWEYRRKKKAGELVNTQKKKKGNKK